MGVATGPEFAQLASQVHGVPEEYPIKVLTPDCTAQPFDVRLRGLHLPGTAYLSVFDQRRILPTVLMSSVGFF